MILYKSLLSTPKVDTPHYVKSGDFYFIIYEYIFKRNETLKYPYIKSELVYFYNDYIWTYVHVSRWGSSLLNTPLFCRGLLS